MISETASDTPQAEESLPTPLLLNTATATTTANSEKDTQDQQEQERTNKNIEDIIGSQIPDLNLTDLDPKGGAIKKKETQNTNEQNASDKKPKATAKEPKKQTQKENNTPNPALIDFYSRFGRKIWNPYLTLKSERPISHIQMECALTKTYATRELRYKQNSETEWMIKTTNQQQSEEFLKMKEINGTRIKVEKNENLNCIYGTITVPTHLNIDITKDTTSILECLQRRDKTIKGLEMYHVPNRRAPTRPILIAKLKYEGDTLPERVGFMGEMRQIREFVPRPMQCTKCNRYAHPSKYCKEDHKCAVCGGPHQTNWNCNERIRCSNCNGSHHAKSKDCIHYKYHTEIKILQTRNALSYGQARFELKTQGFEDPQQKRTYNEVSHNNQERENNKNPQRAQHNDKSPQRNTEKVTKAENRLTRWSGSAPTPNDEDQFWQTNKIQESARNSSRRASSEEETSITTSNRYQALSDTEEQNDEDYDSSTTIDFEDFGTPKKNNKRPAYKTNPGKRQMKKSPEGKQQAKIKRKAEPPNMKTASRPEQTPESQSLTENQAIRLPESAQVGQKDKERHSFRVRSEKTHPQDCGCHYCFVDGVNKLKTPSHETVMEFVKDFCQNKTEPSRHFTPLALCKCASHMKRRIKEPQWIQETAKELISRFHATSKASTSIAHKKETNPQQKPTIGTALEPTKDGGQTPK